MVCVQARFAVAGVVFLLSLPLAAQIAQPAAPAATITSSTALVLIPTVVNDNSGSHISGLRKEDFVLKQDGKSHAIAILEEVKTSSARLHRSSGEQGTYSNFEPGDHNDRDGYDRNNDRHRLSIIVLDFVNTPFSDRASARAALLKFLSDVAQSGEPMCLLALTSGGLTLLHDFTDDPKLLAIGLSQAGVSTAPMIHESVVEADHPPGGGLAAVLTAMIRDQLQSEAQVAEMQTKAAASITVEELQQIAKAFRGLPGRKSLIWASSGFPFSLSPEYDNLLRMMNDAQIAIYSVDLRSATGAMQMSTGGVRPSDIGDAQFDTDLGAREKAADTNSTLQAFAENTGGKAFLGGSNLAESFRRAVQDDVSYYMLGYYVSPSNTKPGWHDVSVTVHTKGAHVRYRNGFFLSRDTSAPSARQDIQLALSSPLDYTGVPVSVSWAGREAGKAPGKTKVQFELVMPANFASVDVSDQNHMLVDIAALAKNAEGNVVAEIYQRIDSHLKPDGLEQIEHNGMTYRNALQLPPGDYTVRFVVRDSLDNRTGSVAAPVKVSP